MTMAEGDYRRRSGEPHSFGAKWTDCSPPSLRQQQASAAKALHYGKEGMEDDRAKGWRMEMGLEAVEMDRHKPGFRVFVCPDLMHRELNPASWGVGIISASLSLPEALTVFSVPVAAPLLQSHRTSLAVFLLTLACGLPILCCVIRGGFPTFGGARRCSGGSSGGRDGGGAESSAMTFKMRPLVARAY